MRERMEREEESERDGEELIYEYDICMSRRTR